ncbi:MAG TPA: nucleoside-diphosphate sugar epimerase/dehydratase [Polaromonas sp.]|uniref:polysaccharide biosynthesis protein n=1 Tax=Polaromonas sp. TaxID=1869339 RepID=UPI002D5F0CF9|nr:nucleoside-diphosphate sugar epimerase/dehydratase [Polaromonas sp.]HYW56828.1 nucleoside-diphosphate sugar epimerase/dehydratase [Polaromonas sp.]
MQRRVLGWPRAAKLAVVIALDVVLAMIATWIAFTLRLDELHSPVGAQWWVYLTAPILAIPVFVKFGLYRAIFRYTGQDALKATGQAVAVYCVALLAVLLWRQWPDVPRSVGVLQPVLFLLLVGSSRALARFWLANLGGSRRQSDGRLLIYGAGTAGVQTASAIGISRQFVLLGFVDDDPAKVGRSINGVRVFAPADVPDLVDRLDVTDLLLALPSSSRERRNKIIASLRSVPIHIRTLPGLADLATGRVTVQDFKELDIEDLLGRDPVPPDTGLLARNLANQVVLVTGAGGSIGSELCRQILLEQPSQLLLLDHNEFGLYNIHQELQGLNGTTEPHTELVPLLGSVANPQRLQEICRAYRPATVFHAAAYKHVPMVESNPAEGIANNVFGTLNIARASLDSGVAQFVLVSTDKAVRPTNIMGASKRMAELILQALAAQSPQDTTCFGMVRFGNVLGSSGSVVPLFRSQLASGGPLTVTHPDVTRYFMTIPEAAQLVLQAGAMSTGGDVFVLDMGEPVKIMDLANRMVELSGLTVRSEAHPGGDIEIAITGLRSGEKLYEELLIGDNPSPTGHPRIMKAHEDYLSWPEFEAHLDTLRRACENGDVASIKSVLRTCVHGYLPQPQVRPEKPAAGCDTIGSSTSTNT